MSESIVQKEKPVLSSVNPFARGLESHVNAGAVAIESERAIAEAQGKLVIAKRFPRDQARAYSNIIDACRRPGLAEEACYSFPRGSEVVSGPAIRLAEMLAANWGNVDYGIRELSRKEGVSEMEAYCWDLETNTMSSQKFTVRHIRDTRGGGRALTDERDIYELTANMGARRLRARILAILPTDLVQAAVDQCSKTLASGGDLPMADRIRAMVLAFKTLGVPAALIEKRLGHPLDNITGEELADLRKIHNSLRDNMSTLTDWFGGAEGAGEPTAQTDDVPYAEGEQEQGGRRKRPGPPPKSVKGAAAVAENPPARTEAPVEQPKTEAPKTDAAPAKEQPAPKTEAQPEAAKTDPKATAAAKVAELKVPEPVAEERKAEASAPAPRAFLKHDEEFACTATVTAIYPLIVGQKDPVTGVKLPPSPSIQAQVKGEFNGLVLHIGGGEMEGTEPVAKAPWRAGAVLKMKLRGKLNKADGKVMARVEAVEEATPGSPAAMEVE